MPFFQTASNLQIVMGYSVAIVIDTKTIFFSEFVTFLKQIDHYLAFVFFRVDHTRQASN